MMGKRLVPVALIFLIFLASCSSPQSSVLTSQNDTLRSAVQEKNNQTVWTKEIEPERLNFSLNNSITVTNKEYITPQLLNSIKELQPAIYPEIKDFASLDCSQMNKALLNIMTDLCDSLCKGTDDLGNFFDYEYFYNCVFFANDLNQAVEKDKKTEKLFDRYLICKSFVSDDLIQVPVRFYKAKETLDLSVFLTYHGDYKVIQIEILGWGK